MFLCGLTVSGACLRQSQGGQGLEAYVGQWAMLPTCSSPSASSSPASVLLCVLKLSSVRASTSTLASFSHVHLMDTLSLPAGLHARTCV